MALVSSAQSGESGESGEIEENRTRSGAGAHASDGRIARGQKTRESILNAYEELIQDAVVPPIGAVLAARAGVSARSIFTHFGDLDGVLAAGAQRAFDWVVRTHVDIALDLPLDERIDRFVARQAEVLERTTPFYRMFRTLRRGARRAKGSTEVLEVLQGVEKLRRRYLAYIFEWEIRSTPDVDDDDLLETLMLSSSGGAWEILRGDRNLEIERARRVMRQILFSLLR